MTPTDGVRTSVPILLIASALPVALAADAVELLALLVLAIVASWALVDRSEKPLFPPQLLTLAAVAAILYVTYEWFFEDVPSVVSLGKFFVLISVCKCLDRKTNRDYGQLFVLSALLMICGAILSGQLIYPVALATYLVVGTYGLILFHIKRETDAVQSPSTASGPSLAGPDPSGVPPVARAVRATAMLGSAGILVVAVVLFFLSPRAAGTGVLTGPRDGGGPAVTGFSTDVDFGEVGLILKSRQEVMRVRLSLNGDNYGHPNLQPYFRAVVFDRYIKPDPEGRSTQWLPVARKTAQSKQLEIGVVPRNLIQGYRPWDKEARIVQDFWLQPNESRTLFSMYPATDIETPQPWAVARWPEDHSLLLLKSPSSTFRYRVSTPTLVAEDLRQAIAREREDNSVPPPSVPENIPASDRVRELAARIRREAADPDDSADVAYAIERHLESGEFAYTLDNTGIDRKQEPVDQFLFERKRGHCEYFAAAMTVLCQLNGIPARLVNGYHGGEYNEVGQFYLVRQEHAHSWVEVFLPSQDWVSFDPTPSESLVTRPDRTWWTKVGEYLDFLEFQWINLFISYDGGRNAQLTSEYGDDLQDSFLRWALGAGYAVRSWIAAPLQLPWHQQIVVWATVLLGFLLAFFILRILVEITGRFRAWYVRRSTPCRRTRDPQAAFYDRLMDILEKKGYRRPLHQTPKEFADRLCRDHPDWQVLPLAVDAYYRIEYGRQHVPEVHLDRIRLFLDSVQCAPVGRNP